MASTLRTGEIRLLPGEVAIKAWQASTAVWGPFLGSGKLYLTSQRLVWTKGEFNILPTPHEIVIDLDSVERCHTPFLSRYYVRLKLQHGAKRTFLIHWGITGAEVAADINAAVQGRHAAHG